jgi:signal transduction histidine kinase
MTATAPARQSVLANPYLLDGAIAVVVAALSLVAVFAGAPDVGPAGIANVVLLMLQALPLAVRRRWPLAVVLVVLGALLAQLAILPPDAELRSSLGPLVALYTAGEQLERRLGIGILVGFGVMLAALSLRHAGLPEGLQSVIQTEIFFVIAWFVGDAARIRRLYARARDERVRLLEAQRKEESRRAVADERARIARELHDAVTHHVSVIVIQAGGAKRALEARPEEARGALEAIDATARLALTDMRRMLGILGEGSSQEPLPGLDRLDALVEQVRGAGLAVELSVEGTRRSLDPGLELSGYRIIQEALTNSLKHAGGGRARVAVRYSMRSLDIEVDDDRGPGRLGPIEPTHEGRGLIGMRERVAMFGGSLSAGPTADGFRITARLPLVEAEPVSAT